MGKVIVVLADGFEEIELSVLSISSAEPRWMSVSPV